MGLAGAPLTLPLGKGTGQGQAAEAEVEVVRPSGEVVRVRARDHAADAWAFLSQ